MFLDSCWDGGGLQGINWEVLKCLFLSSYNNEIEGFIPRLKFSFVFLLDQKRQRKQTTKVGWGLFPDKVTHTCPSWPTASLGQWEACFWEQNHMQDPQIQQLGANPRTVSNTFNTLKTGYAVLSHFSRVQLLAILWTLTHRDPLSMRFSRQEYWSGLPYPPPGDPPDPGIEHASLMSPALASSFFTTSTTWETPNMLLQH